MIKYFKFVTGEEVLAEIIGENATHYTLKNPMRFALTQEGLALIPVSMFLKDDTITILKSNIIFEGEPEESAVNGYNAERGGIVVASGLQLP